MNKTIVASFLLLLSSYIQAHHIPHNNCSWSKPDGELSIGIIGDSLISYPRCSEYSGCPYEKNTALSHFLSEKLNTVAICDKSNGGEGYQKILKQKLPYQPDILILGGSLMDFINCPSRDKEKAKKAKQCTQNYLDIWISEDAKSGVYVDLINEYASEDTQVIIMYSSIVSPLTKRRKWKTVERLILSDLERRLIKLADTSENITWFDVSKSGVDLYDRSNYDPIVAIHPSYKVYEVFAERIKEIVTK